MTGCWPPFAPAAFGIVLSHAFDPSQKDMDQHRDGKAAGLHLVIVVGADPAAGVGADARFLPRFLQGGLGQAAAGHRPALGDDPAAGAAAGDHQHLAGIAVHA